MSSDVSAGVHVFVAQTGVGVVDAKACKGKLVRREVGPLWRRDNEVFVGGRNQTKLATGVQRQVNAVIAALRPDSTLHRIDIHGALCLLDAESALLDFPFQIGNTWVRLKSRPVSRETMARIARRPPDGTKDTLTLLSLESTGHVQKHDYRCLESAGSSVFCVRLRSSPTAGDESAIQRGCGVCPRCSSVLG